MMMDKYLVVVAGPTAVGKTLCAIKLAQAYNTSVVSADSRQIYKELGIGTAKPTKSEQLLVPHYLIDTISIHNPFTAADYARLAEEVIANLFKESQVVVVCGGSGLYLKALLDGMDEIPDIPEEIRTAVRTDFAQYGLAGIQEELRTLDPDYFEQIDNKNPHRVMRALEVRRATGFSLNYFQGKNKRRLPYNIIKIGLDLPREELFARINDRVDQMIAAGLFAEVEALQPLKDLKAMQTVGYQEVISFFEHKISYIESVEMLKRNTRRYAKRQLTWFRADHEMHWFSPLEYDQIIRYLDTLIPQHLRDGRI